MSTQRESSTDDDLWQQIEEHESDLETIARRDDRLGALASIALDLADGTYPSDDDLEALGVDPANSQR